MNDEQELDQVILNGMPHFVAFHYQKLFEAHSGEEKIQCALRVYEIGLRTLALGLVSQYLFRDSDRVSDSSLNELLWTKLPTATLDVWQKILFLTLKVYENKRDLFFMPEVYDFYWDNSKIPPRQKPDIEFPFTRLTQIRNDLMHGILLPANSSDWNKLWTEVYTLLKTVLSEFTFLEKYDLIRITKRDNNLYWYDLYKGLHVNPNRGPLQTSRDLKKGLFYLVKFEPNVDFLILHPLLIFWEDIHNLGFSSHQGETAVYERFVHDSLQYLVTDVWKVVSGDKTVIEFVRLVYHTIEQVKRKESEAERLTWWNLQEIVQAISSRRMANVMGKYRSELYLQRDRAKATFDDFLQSDKVCFILTGKSGVGKSNFLLSLADDYYKRRSDICLLMYNGAKLDAKVPLANIIQRDFDNELRLKGRSDRNSNVDIWKEIHGIEGIEGKKLVLCIDAINENTEAKSLLRKIDELVEDAPWPWLKVVVSSRSEGWRVIKQGVQLAESRYYREKSDDRIEIELEPFTYSQEIRPFTKDELPKVYDKYRDVYNLQTAYSELPIEVKTALRDPLVLRLVADTYQGRQISTNIRVDDVYQKYIDHLIITGRLTNEDLYFLENELMHLMIRNNHYSNAILDREIDQARTSNGKNLFELIHSEAILSNGRKVNQSYTNLVDSEILTQHGQVQSYEIGFKYERFYDFFAARRLKQLLKAEDDGLTEHKFILLLVAKSPYLWGAVHRILLDQLRRGNNHLLATLAYQREQTSHKMLVEVLSEFGMLGKNERNVVKSILDNIINNVFPAALQEGISHAETVAAKLVAVQVASELLIPSILIATSNDRSSAVRTSTVRSIVGIWKTNITVAIEIFNGLAKQVASRIFGLPFPNRRILETALGSGVLIFTLYHRNAIVIKPLSNVARNFFNRLLPIKLDSSVGRLFSSLIYRRFLFSAGLNIINAVTLNRPMYIPANIEEIAAYFKRSKDDRAMMHKVIKIFYEESGPLIEHFDILRQAANMNDGDVNWAIVHVIFKRGIREPMDAVKIIIDIFERQLSREKPSFHAAFLLQAYGELLMKLDSNTPECQLLFKDFEQLVKKYIDKTHCRVYYLRKYTTELLSFYIRSGYTIFRDFNVELVHHTLLQACEECDWELLDAYMRGFRILGISYPRPVLDSIIPLLTDNRNQVVGALTNLLARIRVSYPEEVSEFLLENKHSQELHDRLSIITSEEEMSDLFQHSVTQFLLDATTSETLLDAMVLLLGQMPYVKDHKEWFFVLIAYLMNLFYQGQVLKIKMLPIDVGHKVIPNPYE